MRGKGIPDRISRVSGGESADEPEYSEEEYKPLTVKKDGETLFLTPTEFQILSALIQNNGVIVTRASLLQRIWDSDGNFIDDNTLSVHISRLRDKIGANHIATIRGTGYRWEE